MKLQKNQGVRIARALLIIFVTIALFPALSSSATPTSAQDIRNRAALVASRDKSAAAFRPGGQFTQAVTKVGIPTVLFKNGLPDFWGSCGGTIAINPSSMAPGELLTVQKAVANFTTTASGPWTVSTTTATAGKGSVVVVMVDPSISAKGDWGLAHFTTSFGMNTGNPKFFMNISNATVHLSTELGVLQNTQLIHDVTLHELGHVAGAAHDMTDPRAIMAPAMDANHLGYSHYTAAEAAGIRAGGSHACSN
jgi:hypothetical protein